MSLHPLWGRLALVVALLAAPAALAGNRGIVEGSVQEYSTQPIPKARVLLRTEGRTVDTHVTDARGHFSFEEVPFGKYEVVAQAPDGRSETEAAWVHSGEVVHVDVFLPLLGEQIVITGKKDEAPPPPKTPSSTSTVSREQIRELPKGDSATVNDVLSTQPGFVHDAMGNLYARGNHANIQYQLDGVALPDSVSGVFGGFISPRLVDSMEVITGGLDAEYGDRLAGVVNLNSRRPDADGEGSVELIYGEHQTLNPSLTYGRSFGKLSVLAGGSFNRSERALDPPVVSPIVHDKGDEERGFLKLDYQPNDRDQLTSLTSFARNFYRIPLDPTLRPYDPSLPDGGRTPDAYGNDPAPYFPLDTNQTETETDLFSLLSYRHSFNERSSLAISVFFRHAFALLDGDPAHALGPTQDPCTPDDAGDLSCVTASNVGRLANHVGFAADLTQRLGERHVLKVGAKLDQLFGNTGYTQFTRSDALAGPDPSLTLRGVDRASGTTGGLYAEDRATFGKWVVNAGLRLDFQAVSFDGVDGRPTDFGIGPRLGVAYSITPDTVAHAYAGLLWMPPPVLDTPAAARILGVVPSDQPLPYDLKPEQDRYAELGIASRVVPSLTLSLTAWGKLTRDQLDDVEVGATNLLSPYNFDEGRAGGLEGGATWVLGNHFHAFGNVSFGTAEGRGISSARYLFSPEDLANQDWQLLDHVQTWTANAGTTFHDGGTTLSLLGQYGSGLRTGAANDQHVPGHLVFNLTLAHEFLQAPGRPMLALDVENLFDKHYALRLANGFNGSHYGPGRSVYLRLAAHF